MITGPGSFAFRNVISAEMVSWLSSQVRRTAIFWDVPIIRRMEPGAINLSV